MTDAAPSLRSSPALAAALIELRLMATPRRLLVLLVLTGLAVIAALAFQLPGVVAIPTAGVDAWPRTYVATAFYFLVLPLAALHVGTSIWGDEIENGTLVYVITRPVARQRVLLAKFASAWIVVTAIVVGGIVSTTMLLGILRGTGMAHLAPCVLLAPVASGAWLALAALMGTLVRRSLLLGLGVGVVTEMFLASFVGIARTFTVRHHIGSALLGSSAYQGIPTDELVAGEPVAAWAAWVTLLAVAAGALTLACLVVRYREYAPTRSD